MREVVVSRGNLAVTFPSITKAAKEMGRSFAYVWVCIKKERYLSTDTGAVVKVRYMT